MEYIHYKTAYFSQAVINNMKTSLARIESYIYNEAGGVGDGAENAQNRGRRKIAEIRKKNMAVRRRRARIEVL